MIPSGGWFINADFEEIIVPSLWEQETFLAKTGPELSKQMWTFKDKGDRDVCLIPEVTGIFQETWREKWSKSMKYRKVFYCQRAYRYERPQRDRYREFTQFGVEILGNYENGDQEAQELLKNGLDAIGVEYEFDSTATRGLGYYTELGFEARCESLGAQKQVAGGGRYAEGVGWAIGVDRLVLAKMTK